MLEHEGEGGKQEIGQSENETHRQADEGDDGREEEDAKRPDERALDQLADLHILAFAGRSSMLPVSLRRRSVFLARISVALVSRMVIMAIIVTTPACTPQLASCLLRCSRGSRLSNVESLSKRGKNLQT